MFFQCFEGCVWVFVSRFFRDLSSWTIWKRKKIKIIWPFQSKIYIHLKIGNKVKSIGSLLQKNHLRHNDVGNHLRHDDVGTTIRRRRIAWKGRIFRSGRNGNAVRFRFSIPWGKKQRYNKIYYIQSSFQSDFNIRA